MPVICMMLNDSDSDWDQTQCSADSFIKAGLSSFEASALFPDGTGALAFLICAIERIPIPTASDAAVCHLRLIVKRPDDRQPQPGPRSAQTSWQTPFVLPPLQMPLSCHSSVFFITSSEICVILFISDKTKERLIGERGEEHG